MKSYSVPCKRIHFEHDLNFHAQLLNIRHSLPHFHPQELQLFFCLEGAVNLVAGHQRVTIDAGELFSVDYDEIHYLHADRDNLVLVMSLDLKRMPISWNYLQRIFFACESSHCYPYQQAAMERVIDHVLALSFAYFHDEGRSYDCAASVASLMDLLCQSFDWFTYDNQDDHSNPVMRERFYNALHYCMEHYHEKISAAFLAEQEHINPNYFSQFLSKTVFKSFKSMLLYIRCFKAEHLLLTTNMPNSEIAYACGFSDPKYMYRGFESWWNCSPREHRVHYQAYMSEETMEEKKEPPAAALLIKEYITHWHLKKAGIKNP